ncbi:hypothetical protein ACLB2K_072912 [Fragaria x ananassa]
MPIGRADELKTSEGGHGSGTTSLPYSPETMTTHVGGQGLPLVLLVSGFFCQLKLPKLTFSGKPNSSPANLFHIYGLPLLSYIPSLTHLLLPQLFLLSEFEFIPDCVERICIWVC